MRLVDLVQRDLKRQNIYVDESEIMLLRHSMEIYKFIDLGTEMHKPTDANHWMCEFTRFQPADSRYDFWKDGERQIQVVVVIMRDRLESVDRVVAVYRVLDLEAEDLFHSLASVVFRKFNEQRKHHRDPELRCRLFRMERIPSKCENARVTGWEGKWIHPTARSTDKVALFWEIVVDIPDPEAQQTQR